MIPVSPLKIRSDESCVIRTTACPNFLTFAVENLKKSKQDLIKNGVSSQMRTILLPSFFSVSMLNDLAGQN